MKNKLIYFIIFFFLNTSIWAQVAINQSGSLPNQNAMLDIRSTNKGFLPPRMTSAERMAINAPNGLVVFDTFTQSLWVLQNSVWTKMEASGIGLWSNLNFVNYNTSLTGKVGIGTQNPSYTLDIEESFGTTMLLKNSVLNTSAEYPDINILGFNGSSVLRFAKAGNYDWTLGTNEGIENLVLSNIGEDGYSTSFAIGKTTNNVAFGNGSLINKFEIGLAPGFSGNDLTIGNGTEGMSFFQSGNASIAYTNTNFSLMPEASVGGYLGIGTNDPRVPLHISKYTIRNDDNLIFVYFSSIGGGGKWSLPSTGTTSRASLFAEGSIVTKKLIGAFEDLTFSDQRLKKNIRFTNNEADLEILKKIEITDYTMKDVVAWGHKKNKKVIAQQVEKYYPQAIKKIEGAIPNIYEMANKVHFDEGKSELSFSISKIDSLKIGDKIILISDDNQAENEATIAAIDGNIVKIKQWQMPTKKIFVLGKVVNDLRTVDYDAIAMLSISGVQQLAKKTENLASKIDRFEEKLKIVSATNNK